jgi:hypothetical protein
MNDDNSNLGAMAFVIAGFAVAALVIVIMRLILT